MNEKQFVWWLNGILSAIKDLDMNFDQNKLIEYIREQAEIVMCNIIEEGRNR
jgi:hypothetical protein